MILSFSAILWFATSKPIAFVSGFVTECLSRGATEEHNNYVRSEVPFGLEPLKEHKERAGMRGALASLCVSLQPFVCFLGLLQTHVAPGHSLTCSRNLCHQPARLCHAVFPAGHIQRRLSYAFSALGLGTLWAQPIRLLLIAHCLAH